MFFNIGGGEILVIAMVALIAVGPEQLPSVLRKVGRFMAQVRSMTSGLRDEFMSGLDEVTDAADPNKWMGSGGENDPVVPRGYAQTQEQSAESGNGDGGDSGDGVVVNEIAQANAMRADSPPTTRKPAIEQPAPAAPVDVEPETAEDGEPETETDSSAAADDADAETEGGA